MKNRSEYRHAFRSPTMFFRALHAISSYSYRSSIRRAIIDSFPLDLDKDTLGAFTVASKQLRVISPPSAPIRASLISIMKRTSGHVRMSDSDEDPEEVELGRMFNPTGQPSLSLRPQSQIIGFG